MKGVYLVFLVLEEDSLIGIGALGEKFFESGVYVYVGSAMNSLESRVSRHFSEVSNLHWHIDYLTDEAETFAFTGIAADSEWECILAEAADDYCEPVNNFGSSDCSCASHLFRIGEKDLAPENVLTPENRS